MHRMAISPVFCIDYQDIGMQSYILPTLLFSAWLSKSLESRHLGEYAEWEKRTNWELGTRIPLIMRVPWMPSAASGKHARGLVEAARA